MIDIMRIVFCFIVYLFSLLSAFAQSGNQSEFLTIKEAMSIVSYRRYHPMMDTEEFEGFIKPMIGKYGYREDGFLEGIGTCSFWQYVKHGHIVHDNQPEDMFVPDNDNLAGTLAVIDCDGIETIEDDETSISVEIRVFSEASRDKFLEDIRSIGFQYKKTEDNIREYVYQSYDIEVWNGITRGHRMWQFTIQLYPRDYGTTKHYEYADSSSAHNLKIQVDYPVKGSPVLLRRVRTFIMEALEYDLLNSWPMARYNGDASDGQAVINDYGRRVSVSLKEKHESGVRAFEEETTIKKVAENDCYISFEVEKYGWYGGVTNILLYGATFRKSDGRRLHVIANAQSPQFRQFLNNDLIFEKKDEIEEEYRNNIPMPKYEPYLIQTGVRFIWQKYEIAAGAAGYFKEDASFSGIKQFLSDEVLEVLK